LKLAVFGDQGLLGADLAARFRQNGHEVIGFNRANFQIDSNVADLAICLDGVESVVNAIAYTAVDQAESDSDTAFDVNGRFPGRLAEACNLVGSKIIQVSTDYVFDGLASEPYRIDAERNPKTVYGQSKLLGEDLVLENSDDSVILRTAWLYGRTGSCFPRTIAKKLQQHGSVKVVDDQVGQPTWVGDVSKVIEAVVQDSPRKAVVHATSAGAASWADFAEEVARTLGLNPSDVVSRVSSLEFATVAERPGWSVLDNSGAEFGQIGDWRQRWREVAAEILRA
jgi:dTDP-4-dehydrorhamnose reductase